MLPRSLSLIHVCPYSLTHQITLDNNSVPSGTCTERKTQLCNNAYFLITGKPDKRAKCCPDTSGCVKNMLMLESNSVCSTKCGDSCFGTIEGQDPLEPKILCVFEDSAWSEEMGLKNCYDNITKPFCEDVVGADPPIDVGEVKCADYVPPVEGGSAGCDGAVLVCCNPPNITQVACDVGVTTSFASNSVDALSVLLLAQCQPEKVPV